MLLICSAIYCSAIYCSASTAVRYNIVTHQLQVDKDNPVIQLSTRNAIPLLLYYNINTGFNYTVAPGPTPADSSASSSTGKTSSFHGVADGKSYDVLIKYCVTVFKQLL